MLPLNGLFHTKFCQAIITSSYIRYNKFLNSQFELVNTYTWIITIYLSNPYATCNIWHKVSYKQSTAGLD